jgi:two-component system cell cycle response regulator DivK
MTRILFIDDDVLVLQLMSKISNLLGFQIITSTSPRSGLALAAHENPSVIMVDMQMDEMDGPEFIRAVRGSPEIAHLPVLVCSAGISYIDEEQARSAGADGFLQKPISLSQLTQVVQAYAT